MTLTCKHCGCGSMPGNALRDVYIQVQDAALASTERLDRLHLPCVGPFLAERTSWQFAPSLRMLPVVP